MATPTNTSSTFPLDELMQADYTYTGQAIYDNTGVYSGSVNANPEYEYETYTCSSGQYLAAGGTSCSACPTGRVCPGGTYTYNANNNQGIWKFSLTTTNTTTSFQFFMTAVGTFTVDCGDGGTLTGTGVSGNNTITRSNTTSTTYTCTWGSAGAHKILFDGTATNYSTSQITATISFNAGSDYANQVANAAKIASISGNLSTIFPYISGNAADGAQPRFSATFLRATNLTSIPATLFADYTTASTRMFSYTFATCTGLTSAGIPSNLFFPNAQSVSGVQGMFALTFDNCTGLTSIPTGLFSKITSGARDMFNGTFFNCTGLTSAGIPSNLFFPNAQSVSGAQEMFTNTFNGCTGLTYIPEHLFSKITSGAENMFSQTFNNCSNLGCATAGCSTGTGYIPSTLFAGITPRGDNATNTMSDTFKSTKLVTTCPAGTVQYVTGWESKWNSKVLCTVSHNITYVMDGGTNYNGAPTTYGEGIGAMINGVPTKSGYVFVGWCTDDQLQSCAMSQTIGTDATTDQTFYAKWTQCNACAATNASCELSVVNNVCTYTTACNETSVNIQHNGEYNAYCTACTACDATNATCSLSVVNDTCTYATACNNGYGNIQNNGAYNVSCSACTPCSATNASCSFDGTVNNVCTYTTSCNNGYSNIQNNGAYNASCSANAITITWNGALQSDIDTNEAGTTTYGNDIRTPVRPDPAQIPAGMQFKGWRFEKVTYNVTYACGDGATGTAPTDSTDYAPGEYMTSLTAANTCTKAGNTFTGWSCGGTNVNAGSKFKISANTTCSAQWSQCNACAATNATCSFDGVVNNVCTYTTVCNNGYGNIQNNGAYNASCSSLGFDLSTITGANLEDGGTEMGLIMNDGNVTYNASIYGLTENGTWGVTLADESTKVRGIARCSDTDDGKEYAQTGNPGSATTGQYCWCKADGYQASGESTWQAVTSNPWVVLGDGGGADGCASSCADGCAGEFNNNPDIRRAVFGISE